LLARIKKAGWLSSHHARRANGQDFTLAPYKKRVEKLLVAEQHSQAS